MEGVEPLSEAEEARIAVRAVSQGMTPEDNRAEEERQRSRGRPVGLQARAMKELLAGYGFTLTGRDRLTAFS